MGAPADSLILSQRSRIVRFAVEHRIPAMYEFREFVSDGGLLSYGPNLMEMFRRSATYADSGLAYGLTDFGPDDRSGGSDVHVPF